MGIKRSANIRSRVMGEGVEGRGQPPPPPSRFCTLVGTEVLDSLFALIVPVWVEGASAGITHTHFFPARIPHTHTYHTSHPQTRGWLQRTSILVVCLISFVPILIRSLFESEHVSQSTSRSDLLMY